MRMWIIPLVCSFLIVPVVHPGSAQMAPALDYNPVPETFKLPAGANFGGTSGIAFNSKGNIFVAETDWGRRVQKFKIVASP